MQDETETIRRAMTEKINAEAADRAALEREHGQVWNSNELQEEFWVSGFMAPFVVVTRKSDGQAGSLMFQHSPRFYFGWTPDKG